MALDNENLTPKVRSLDTPSKPMPNLSASLSPSKTVKKSQVISEVQVPSTLPQHDEDGLDDKDASQEEQIRSDPSENLTGATEDDHKVETADTQANPIAELPGMNWAEFQGRYREAIDKADEDERKLLEEFEKYFEVFRIWAQATSQRDTDRGWKRLRTRQRFVQLAEENLEEKKAHYEQVVQAFKAALDLLRR